MTDTVTVLQRSGIGPFSSGPFTVSRGLHIAIFAVTDNTADYKLRIKYQHLNPILLEISRSDKNNHTEKAPFNQRRPDALIYEVEVDDSCEWTLQIARVMEVLT